MGEVVQRHLTFRTCSPPRVQTLPSAPRVVIVDADRRVLQSLSDLLGVSGEVDVVGRATDVRAALEQIEREHPDVVLVDPRLPDIDAGMALIGGMARAWPSMRVVVTGWGGDAEGPRRAEWLDALRQQGRQPRGVRRRHRRRLSRLNAGRRQRSMAARIASSSAGIGVREPSSAWTASGSLSPWPVRTQTTVSS